MLYMMNYYKYLNFVPIPTYVPICVCVNMLCRYFIVTNI